MGFFSNLNPFTFLERGTGGPNIGGQLKSILSQADTAGKVGTANVEEGLGDLRTISGNYQDLISKGGLTDALNKTYADQQGQISDDVVRAGRAFQASMAQTAAQNGGVLSPAAQAELEKENAQQTNESAFTARNQVAFNKAQAQQTATSQLQDRILQIADAIRTTGLTREQQAVMAKLSATGLSITRMQDIMKDILGSMGSFGM